jgi:diguanylate cyclase (GGDEF)-like protein
MKNVRVRVTAWCERQPASRIVTLGCVMVAVLGTFDFLSGSFEFLIFYLVPVFFVTWFANKRSGVAVSSMSALIWLVDDRITAQNPQHVLMPLWNLFVSFGFLLFAVSVVTRLKSILQRERELANTDYLTKVANSRFFSEVMQGEVDRSRRYNHILTLAYIDVDNFKAVNDRFGHSAGDALLTMIAANIKANIRTVDFLARLGGDEFAILFPETDAQAAKIVIDRIRDNIDKTAHGKDWPITISVGVVTCPKVPVSIDKLVMLADEAMYMAKMAGKNSVTYREYAT